ncbi:acyl-CoA dehydrogenase family protein [Dehalococcoidia bacterium]|nr:acyl-CoA dehydrogenase family protein [Dehalococcoidia bacterium]MCL0101601.1 acyl-CoA dehydrogenase family protein [Dehalococcoidia bacterium]
MEYRFTQDQESFREKVRGFLKDNLPTDWRGVYPDSYFHDENWSFIRSFTKKMADLGWLTIHWPKEYGGQGLPVLQQVVLNEELAYHSAPSRDVSTGVNLAGPTLMIHGTDAQKNDYLPPIANAEHVYTQGFSEPGSGSDLASLGTRAIRDGDDYIINGSKIWTSGAHRSSHCLLLTRTDPDAPKHRGISMFILPMETPGITVQPILNPLNIHYFNQVFFDNVRVPASSMIGPENRGWYTATTTLDFERSGVARFANNQRSLDTLIALSKESHRPNNPVHRNSLAEAFIANRAGRAVAYRVAWMQGEGMVPNQEASASKLMGSEIAQRVSQLGIKLLGLYGQINRDSIYSTLEGHIMAEYVNNVSVTIRAGTSEIQRGIIASRGLGLPRG